LRSDVPRADVRRVTELWQETFGATVVIATEGHEARLQKLIDSVPFDPAILTIDRCARGLDCRTGRRSDNHHLIVGNRHKTIVETAARAGLRNVCVLEDDTEFVGRNRGELAAVLEWVRTHSDRWDVFYLGFGAPLLTHCSYAARNVIRTYRPFFAHALCYNHRIYDRILAIDFSRDHRPFVFRAVERIASNRRRQERYFQDGVGSLDTWLSFSGLRLYAAHPLLAIQTALPPGTEASWRKRTGTAYDPYRTPEHQVRVALALHYSLWGAAAFLALAAGGLYLR
jgi:hypothetical protein